MKRYTTEKDSISSQDCKELLVDYVKLKKDADTWKTCAEGLKESLGITSAELSALKKDARIVAKDSLCDPCLPDFVLEAARRILAATEEEEEK
jgi:hypothetical protein